MMMIAASSLLASGWTLDAGARMAARAPAASKAGGSILDLPQAERWCTDNGLSERHLLKVYGHLFRRGGEFTPAALHTDAELPRATADAMCAHFCGTASSRVVQRVPSDLKLCATRRG